MKMEDLDLKVSDVSGVSPQSSLSGGRALVVTLVAAVFLLVCLSGALTILLWRGMSAASTQEKPSSLSTDDLKELALKLEDRGVIDESARFWSQYLESPGLSRKETASASFRLGTLYQKDRQWGKALSWYYQADRLSQDAELSADVGRRIQECLEGMGAVTALRRELKERTSVSTKADVSDPACVAEIDGEKFFRSDLESLVESEVDMKLKALRGQLQGENARKERERMIKKMTGLSALRERLSTFVVEEVLSREARRLGMDKNEDIQGYLRHIERQLLAQRLLTKEISSRLSITSTDINNHYLANKDKFSVPAGVRFRYAVVEDKETAEAVEEKARQEGGLTPELVPGKELEIVQSPGWMTEETDWKMDISYGSRREIMDSGTGDYPVVSLESEKGYLVAEITDKRETRLPALQEIQKQVEQDLVQHKASEAQDSYMLRLWEKYDVVIHSSVLSPQKDEPEQEHSGGSPGNKSIPLNKGKGSDTL